MELKIFTYKSYSFHLPHAQNSAALHMCATETVCEVSNHAFQPAYSSSGSQGTGERLLDHSNSDQIHLAVKSTAQKHQSNA